MAASLAENNIFIIYSLYVMLQKNVCGHTIGDGQTLWIWVLSDKYCRIHTETGDMLKNIVRNHCNYSLFTNQCHPLLLLTARIRGPHKFQRSEGWTPEPYNV